MHRLPALLLLLAACGSTPEAPAPVEAPPTVHETPAPAPLPDGALRVDNSKSKVGWVAHKVIGSHPIVVEDYVGAITLSGEKVHSVRYTAKMASLKADHPKLTAHLLNADFFNVEAFPESSFTSSAIQEGSTVEGFTHTVTGDLTVMGITQRITFPASIQVEPTQVVAKASFELDRRDYKLVYPGMPDNLIQDIVPMSIELVAPRP